MNILITGGRAPAALDLGRILKEEGHSVFIADSLKVYLSKGSSVFAKSFILPKPVSCVQAFINKLNDIINEEKIELIIPTCEEVFFISKYKSELKCNVFCDEFAKLELLHNKYKLPNWINRNIKSSKAPKTELITSKSLLSKYEQKVQQLVFKPVYSRFAAFTLIKPSIKKLKQCLPTKINPWIAQEYVKGKEYCTYSIAYKGKLTAHAAYLPIYRIGLGASMYFLPIENDKILKFIEEFVKNQNYTGQIGFDIIEDKYGNMNILECNPRATSGLHFLKGNNITKCFTGKQKKLITIKTKKPLMSVMAMLVIGLLKYWFVSPFKFSKDISSARDVVYDRKDLKPFFYQFYVLIFIIYSAVKNKTSLHAASSVDTEWNGEKI